MFDRIGQIRAVRHEPASPRITADRIDRRHVVLSCEHAMRSPLTSLNVSGATISPLPDLLSEQPDGGFDVRSALNVRDGWRDPERGRGGFERLRVECSVQHCSVRIGQQRDPRDGRRDLFQNAKPFARKRRHRA
jgi:hypothetical protein